MSLPLALWLMLASPIHAHPCQPAAAALAQDLSKALDAHEARSAQRITSQDVIYEELAHDFAYQDQLGPRERQLLTGWGYQPPLRVRGRHGLDVLLFQPLPDSQRRPVLAFRGTEPTDLGDVLTDMDPEIGERQFDDNRQLILRLLDQAQGPVDVVGHSLGGALAQQAAAAWPHRFHQVVAFQSPGVSRRTAEAFSRLATRPAVRFHLSRYDAVDLGGEAHLSGEFFLHTPRGRSDPITAHTDYLLLSPRYRELRDAVGLSEQVDRELHGGLVDAMDPQAQVVHHDSYPAPIRQVLVEQLRRTAVEEGRNALRRFLRGLFKRGSLEQRGVRPLSGSLPPVE